MELINKVKRNLSDTLSDFYRLTKGNLKIAYLSYNLNKYRKKHPRIKNNKMRIVFIVQRTEVFSSVFSIFKNAVEDSRCEVFLLPLPRCANRRFELLWDTYSDVVKFCEELKGGIILKTFNFETNEFYDLRKINPDYIFLNVPYTEQYPEMYRMKKLSYIAKVCYVPYGYSMSNEKKYEFLRFGSYSSDFLGYTSFFFADDIVSYKYCKRKSLLSEILAGKHIFCLGYPRFDRTWYSSVHETKTILWLPRWTTQEQAQKWCNLGSTFFDYNQDFLEYFQYHQDKSLIIRPHPLAFDNYIQTGMMSEDEVKRYKDIIKKASNITLDENSSYEQSFAKSDILVADITSIMIEFFIIGKPIIYLGSKNDFSSSLSAVVNTFYYASNWGQLKSILDDLNGGNDSLKNLREQEVEKFKLLHSNAGTKIMNQLLNDWIS